MLNPDFVQYTLECYGTASGTSNSYKRAIEILDEIFMKLDMFELNGKSISYITDPADIQDILQTVRFQEEVMRHGKMSIFSSGSPKQTSYPMKRFCSAAVAHLLRFAERQQHLEADNMLKTIKKPTGKKVSSALIDYFDLNREGLDTKTELKIRVGQNYFRRMVLTNYQSQCCVTGLNVPELLRASHIMGWAKDMKNRMNPENGLCLSATYDAAFDQHLITFDDDYRMVVSKVIKEYYTAEVTREYFEKFEGKPILMPIRFLPDKELLAKHRDCLVK